MNVFLHVTEMAIVNAHAIYNFNLPTEQRLTGLQFRLKLADELLALASGGTYKAKIGRPSPTRVEVKFGNRFPERAEKTAVCFYHGGRTGRKQSRTRCKTCQIHFCTFECFERHQRNPDEVFEK